MCKAKRYSQREMEKIVRNNGFDYIGCKGDHFKYKRNDDIIILTKNTNPMVFRRIVKENRLSIK